MRSLHSYQAVELYRFGRLGSLRMYFQLRISRNNRQALPKPVRAVRSKAK